MLSLFLGAEQGDDIRRKLPAYRAPAGLNLSARPTEVRLVTSCCPPPRFYMVDILGTVQRRAHILCSVSKTRVAFAAVVIQPPMNRGEINARGDWSVARSWPPLPLPGTLIGSLSFFRCKLETY